jgi:hypothetical protein
MGGSPFRPNMQHLLDDLDNFGWWRRFTYVGELSELTFRYGVVAMNDKRNITFAEQCKEVRPARLPGITVCDNRCPAPRLNQINRTLYAPDHPSVRAGTVECVLQFRSSVGFVLQNEDQQASEGPLQDATCHVRAFVRVLHGRKCGALIHVSMRPT